MRTKNGEKFKLESVEELLGIQNEESAMDIEINKICPFRKHPFKVIDDEKMQELVESITSRSFFIHSERESHVTSAASFNTTNSISVSFNVMMLLLLRFFSFFLGAIVLLPFR